MLTGKMVRVRFARERVLPHYLNTAEPSWQELAERLLELFRGQEGRTRGELEGERSTQLEGQLERPSGERWGERDLLRALRGAERRIAARRAGAQRGHAGQREALGPGHAFQRLAQRGLRTEQTAAGKRQPGKREKLRETDKVDRAGEDSN